MCLNKDRNGKQSGQSGESPSGKHTGNKVQQLTGGSTPRRGQRLNSDTRIRNHTDLIALRGRSNIHIKNHTESCVAKRFFVCALLTNH